MKASNWWRWLSIGRTSFRLMDEKFHQDEYISWIGKWEILVSKFEQISQLCSWKVPFVTMFESQNCDGMFVLICSASTCTGPNCPTMPILWRSLSIPCLCFQYTIYCGYMWKLLQHPFQLYCKSSNKFWRLIDQSFPKVEIISTLHATNQYDQKMKKKKMRKI